MRLIDRMKRLLRKKEEAPHVVILTRCKEIAALTAQIDLKRAWVRGMRTTIGDYGEMRVELDLVIPSDSQ